MCAIGLGAAGSGAGGGAGDRATVGALRQPARSARAADAGDHRAGRQRHPVRSGRPGRAALRRNRLRRRADAGADGAPALLAVDHIAFGMPQDQLDSWMLFCRAVLGLEPGDSLELADPFGLIRSSGVANASRSVRFVLNVSLSQRTRTARTVTASGGQRRASHRLLLRRHLRERRALARPGRARSCRSRPTTTTI